MDLFALGVILFILRSGHPPFRHAIKSDNVYKTLMDNKNDIFWKFHSRGKDENFYSPEFKALVTSMLQHNPSHRLNMTDIIGHPWLAQGPVSTYQ